MRSIKSGSDYIYTVAFKTDANAVGTGLTPALTMYKMSDDSVIINAQDMAEVANGIYKYTIPTASLVSGSSYAIYVDGGATLTTFRYQYDSIDIDKMPIGSEISDAVLDEALSGHTTAGTLGAVVSDINTMVNTISATVSTLGNITGGTVNDYLTEFKLTDNNTNNALAGFPVWLTTGSAKTPYFVNPQNTNSGGYVFWYLSPGAYYLWVAGQDNYMGILNIASNGTPTFTERS